MFFNILQYLNPLEAESYRETARAIRMIGKDCIQKRIKAIESGEEIPNDILSLILRTAGICYHKIKMVISTARYSI